MRRYIRGQHIKRPVSGMQDWKYSSLKAKSDYQSSLSLIRYLLLKVGHKSLFSRVEQEHLMPLSAHSVFFSILLPLISLLLQAELPAAYVRFALLLENQL